MVDVEADSYAILQTKLNGQFVNVCPHRYHVHCSTRMKASKVKDGGQNVCSYCREPYTHIKIVEKNSSRVVSLEEFKRSTCGKCRGDLKKNSEICQC